MCLLLPSTIHMNKWSTKDIITCNLINLRRLSTFQAPLYPRIYFLITQNVIVINKVEDSTSLLEIIKEFYDVNEEALPKPTH